MQYINNALCCDRNTYDIGNMKLHEGNFKRRKIDDTGGLHTGGLVKEAMYNGMKEALATNSLHFIKNGLSLHGEDDSTSAWNYNLATLKKQFANFQIKMKVPKPDSIDWNHTKYTYSGKDAGPDDIITALMLNMHWSYIYRSNANNFQTYAPV